MKPDRPAGRSLRARWARWTGSKNAVAEVWGDLAARHGGTFEVGRFGRERVVLTHRGWTLTLEKYVVQAGTAPLVYTRVRALYAGARELKAKVRPRNWLDNVLRAFGYGRRLPIRRALLERYVVKGSPPARLPSFFSPELSDALLQGSDLHLEVDRAPRKDRRRLGDDTGEVACRTSGVILDPVRLDAMIDVAQAALDALHRIGEAADPEGGAAFGD